MSRIQGLLAATCLALSLLVAPAAFAGDTDPLFVNATTDQPHRAKMALVFASKQLERKHPVTVFLNDRAVVIGSKKTTKKFAEHQKLIADIVKGGGNVLICPMCMEHYSVKEGDLIAGIKVGNPELTGSLLFKDNTKTLSW
jgi:predicted peroxiredoxin